MSGFTTQPADLTVFHKDKAVLTAGINTPSGTTVSTIVWYKGDGTMTNQTDASITTGEWRNFIHHDD